jgi:hypothetical protein
MRKGADRTNALAADTITSFCAFTLTRQHPQDPFLVTSSGPVALPGEAACRAKGPKP